MKDTVIYGAGNFGKRMLAFLQAIGGEVKFFVQSSKPNENEFEGIPVISVEEYLRKKYRYIVFVAINDSDIVNDIYELFLKNNYDRNKIFDCRSFIEDNQISSMDIAEGNKVCNLCGHRIKKFLSSGIDTKLFTELRVIGGGYRKNATCPYCKCLDRTRWVYQVLKEETDLFDAENTVLHFAPEKMIQEKLRRNKKCDYYPGDIVLKPGNHRIDVTDIPYRDAFFDYILINHVLEHVKNETQAFSELRRVIKPDGKLVLSFPVTLDAGTIEKDGVFNDEDRLKYYGQKDHVRLYGKDYIKRIENLGWEIQQYTPERMVDERQIEKYGFLRNDILLLCKRRD